MAPRAFTLGCAARAQIIAGSLFAGIRIAHYGRGPRQSSEMLFWSPRLSLLAGASRPVRNIVYRADDDGEMSDFAGMKKGI